MDRLGRLFTCLSPPNDHYTLFEIEVNGGNDELRAKQFDALYSFIEHNPLFNDSVETLVYSPSTDDDEDIEDEL
jgi:hypothetical protein